MTSALGVPNTGTAHATAILGGGPAGLSVGYHLAKLGISSSLFEAESTIGGACRTFELRGLRFDTGAHRLHNVLPDVTSEIRSLLGDDLAAVDAPSHIYHRGTMVPFPPTVIGLARALGLGKLALSLAPVLLRRRQASNFRDHAIGTYGRLVAESFLLNYSEKLWGGPAHQLAVEVSGRRLDGLDTHAQLRRMVGLRQADHIDGAFLYPRRGFGQITDALAARIPHLHTRAKVDKLLHRDGRISAISLSDGRWLTATTVVSTLPVTSLVSMLDPPASPAIRELAASLRYRHVRLAMLPIRAVSVSRSATLYFPSTDVAFTRIYEPKRRSADMAPPDQTCLVLEYPVFESDAIDRLSREDFLSMSRKAVLSTGLVPYASVLEGTEQRIPHAYPVLDVAATSRLAPIDDYLRGFSNLHRVGRAACFRYSHFHDQMRDGRLLAEHIARGGRS